MLWMIWMCLFWTMVLSFMLVNYFTGGALFKKMFSEPKSESTRARRSLKIKHESKFAKILNKFFNE